MKYNKKIAGNFNSSFKVKTAWWEFLNLWLSQFHGSMTAPLNSFFRIPTKNDDKTKMLKLGLNIVAVITDDMVNNSNLKTQLKNKHLILLDWFLLTWIFQYISNWWKAFWDFPHPLYLKYIDKVISLSRFICNLC